jgi:hypothetical protein
VAQDCSEPGGFLAIGLGFQHGDSRAEVAHATVDRISTRATTQSGASQSRLTVITDGANSLQNIYRRLPFPTQPILDWFHISMRVRYLEQIASGLTAGSETEWATKRLLIGTSGQAAVVLLAREPSESTRSDAASADVVRHRRRRDAEIQGQP